MNGERVISYAVFYYHLIVQITTRMKISISKEYRIPMVFLLMLIIGAGMAFINYGKPDPIIPNDKDCDQIVYFNAQKKTLDTTYSTVISNGNETISFTAPGDKIYRKKDIINCEDINDGDIDITVSDGSHFKLIETDTSACPITKP